MVIQAQQVKRDEQHPLLKVDTGGLGGEDAGLPQQPPPAMLSQGWKVACTLKRSWLVRWPEFISACWMTLILLGITFLVFYTLGMSAYRRKSVIIVKCNTSKPESNVYFHHIIPRGSYSPFSLYSEYLSSMAMEYPFLHIHVHFLVDDSSHDSYYGSKHLKLFKRFSQPLVNFEYPATMNERDRQELKIFQQRYGNINITIMNLSQYMTMTPLKHKWKTIPTYYLSFYVRIFAVWEFGGIGLDLSSLNNRFNNNQMLDQRMTAILRQHNDGIEDKKYIQTLNSINKEDETEFFNLFYNVMANIFSKTDSFFDTPLIDYPVATKSRNYRNKREAVDTTTNKTSELKSDGNISSDTNKTTLMYKKKDTDLYSMIMNSKYDKVNNTARNNSLSLAKENSTIGRDVRKSKNRLNVTKVEAEIPHVILFYDFSVLPKNMIGPSYVFPENQAHKSMLLKETNRSPYVLSISADGTFVAATSLYHPFLGHLLSSSSSRVSPRLAIENAMSFQCPVQLTYDEYCDNIYILK